MQPYSDFLKFRLDTQLSPRLRKNLDPILNFFRDVDRIDFIDTEASNDVLTVDFVSENSLHLARPKNCLRICLIDDNQSLFSYGQTIDDSQVDFILDDSIDFKQLMKIISPHIKKQVCLKEEKLFALGFKNIRKFESKVRHVIKNRVEDAFTSEALLSYTQALVDLERDLIQADSSSFSKILKKFTKDFIEKSRFQYFSEDNLAEIELSENFLILPAYKGHFAALEMNWNEDDPFKLIKRFFFFYTLINFFKSKLDIKDPFFDQTLWESVLDGIPFPVVLLSENGEIHQHNSLFSKLGFPPMDCLNLKLREKVQINNIPYNIYRKESFHLDQNKILFVFFTESFFLKGDDNLTPSGQELGIISSSIAHELNNPIAGIQAALTIFLLDESLTNELKQTVLEMKNGALRCKQLVETFLGFSRANPTLAHSANHNLGPIDFCYQQAQNLLRFRTVESGIRFNFDYIKHADFRSQINPSLLTMTFYLILGELMTLYSHQMLVANKNQIEKVIKGEIVESSHEIQIQLYELNISNLVLSKLIQNLLTIENFTLQISDYSLRFIYTYCT